MFGTGLIVFRETLEAALFVGIVAAATRSVPNRTRWLMLGAVAGMVGSLLMATAIEQISDWANGLGQDLVNVVILSVALLMLTWHNVWMARHGRELAAHSLDGDWGTLRLCTALGGAGDTRLGLHFIT